MGEAVQILTVKADREEGLLVAFSDGTVAAYTIRELLELRPKRAVAMSVRPKQTIALIEKPL